MYNTHYKKLYCPELHHSAIVTNGDLVITCPDCQIVERYRFGRITRAQFDALAGPLTPIDSLPPPIS